MSIIAISVMILGGIGIISAAILYLTAKKFHVEEDPNIEAIDALLPGANCGACGYSGCHDFAVNCASAETLDGHVCPSSGQAVMDKIAEILGMKAANVKTQIAVLHCNGTCENRPKTSKYDGPSSCNILHSLYIGSSDCAYGCLGEGDCMAVCRFDAIKMNTITGLPEFDEEKCVGCGICVKGCPRHIIELRDKGPKGRRVYAACANKEKGALAIKECKTSCIGCGKCVKECSFQAITVTDNLAYIDYSKCKLCRKCIDACPTHVIHAVNFPTPQAIKKEGGESC
ncbi:MAG: RnfABCDGE type electron transport complex subunit B [Muribaculaceae bacterium]